VTKAIYIDMGILDWFVSSGHKKYQNRYLFCISLGMVKTRKYVTGLKFQLILHTD